jgi:hypothetical protein
VGGWFHHRILETGRLPLFCFFIAFLVTFIFIRVSVRLIRAEVKWWPGNVTPGGLHIHHAVFGVVLMVVGGLAGLAVPNTPLPLPTTFAVIFGIGTALVLDEFALILHLDDVYWSSEGRLSVDAIFVAVGVTGMLLLGVTPSIASDVKGATASNSNAGGIAGTSVAVAFDFALVAITLLKGKVWTGLFGLFLPILSLVGAIRVGRPASPWARKFYKEGHRKAEKSRHREIRTRRAVVKIKNRVQDLLAGSPTSTTDPATGPVLPADTPASGALQTDAQSPDVQPVNQPGA